jgi:hypothetical protein
MKSKKQNKYYVKRAQGLIPEIQKLLNSVSECLNKSEMFPIYLKDLQEMVDNLTYLDVAQNAVINMEYEEFLNKSNKNKKRKIKK